MFPIDYAITNKLTPFISMQNHHSLLYREEEREMFPTLKVCARQIDPVLLPTSFDSSSVLDVFLGHPSDVAC